MPELARQHVRADGHRRRRLETSRRPPRSSSPRTARTRPSRRRSTAARRWPAPTTSSRFQVGGLESTLIDFEIPKRYGLRQTIGDTLGVGGISRALRTIPVLLDVCRDMEELCPDALLLQYVNPMAMLCWAVAARSPIRTVGLCHSVQHTTGELAADLGVPAEEIDAHVAGINHLAFFLRLERGGEDLYPALREVEPPAANRVRYEVLRHFGAFVTESSEHFAEYVPWFIKAAPPRADRALQHPARRVRAARALSPGGAARDWERARSSVERSARVRRRHHPRVRDRRAVPLQRQRAERPRPGL